MDRIRIHGGRPLRGTIPISGAKNAALTLMPACLLTEGSREGAILARLSEIEPIAYSREPHGGSMVPRHLDTARSVAFTAATITSTTAPYDLVRKMRASVLVLGPLLARCGVAHVSLPGGCAIGSRPVDLHLQALEQMGAKIVLEEGYIKATTDGKRLSGAHIVFPQVTVGGTENLLMAATLAQGKTVLSNAAREPEITDLAQCLMKMGAKIDGLGSSTLTIEGVDQLHGAYHSVVPDRIEAGTYAVAAAMTRGQVLLQGANPEHMEATLHVLRNCGATVEVQPQGILISAEDRDLVGTDVMTAPYPGFATDMQAQFMALMTTAKGASMLTESIFENRFMHVPELLRMGAKITTHTASAIVRGVDKLSGAQVMATDLRASSSLILAGLAAEGETVINRVYHLDRGYEQVEAKLAACGAQIERLRGNDSDGKDDAKTV